jgi:hypothetical protein
MFTIEPIVYRVKHNRKRSSKHKDNPERPENEKSEN